MAVTKEGWKESLVKRWWYKERERWGKRVKGKGVRRAYNKTKPLSPGVKEEG